MNEYERFDVITNARVVTPEVVIFPAITICTSGVYQNNYYINKTLVRTETTKTERNILDKLILTNKSYFKNKEKKLNVDQLEFFKMPKKYSDCVRLALDSMDSGMTRSCRQLNQL